MTRINKTPSIEETAKTSSLNIFTAFENYLREKNISTLRFRDYRLEAEEFAVWFVQEDVVQNEIDHETALKSFDFSIVTNKHVREYHLMLIFEKNSNWKLTAFYVFMDWARQTNQIAMDLSKISIPGNIFICAPWLGRNEQLILKASLEKELQVTQVHYPLRYVARRRDASLTRFLLHTGLMVREAVALKLGDIQEDCGEESIFIKGKKRRIIPLNTEARTALQDWLTIRPKAGNDFIWMTEGQLTTQTVQNAISRQAVDSNIYRLDSRILRHTFAKNLLNDGVTVEKVAFQMGNTSLNTTRIYFAPSGNLIPDLPFPFDEGLGDWKMNIDQEGS